MSSWHIFIIFISFTVTAAAMYFLYSIVLFKGISKKGDELQLSTKHILEQVQVLFDKKEYALAELLATKYLERIPGHLDVRFYLAKSYYENKKFNAAIQQCLIILKKTPYNIDVKRLLGDCYIKRGELNKAILEYDFIYDHRKDDKEVIQTLAELYRETEQPFMSVAAYNDLVTLVEDDARKAEIYSILAELNIEIHDFPATFEAYKARLAIYPQDYDTNKDLVELYVEIKNYPAAIETLLYMLSFTTEPKLLLWVNEILVDLYEQMEDYEKAVRFAESMLELQGADKFKIRERIASFNIKLGKTGDGILILEDLVLMSQNAYDVTLHLAQAYLDCNEFEKALERYKTLLDKATPKEAKEVNQLVCKLYIEWAISVAEKKDYAKSYDLLNSAIQYNPINPEIYYNIAKNNYEQKNYNNTVESIDRAREYDKTNEYQVKYLLLESDAYHQLGNFFYEKKTLSDLLKVDEKNPKGLYRLGLMHLAQHDIKNAEEAFKKALEYSPDLIEAKYNLALLYENNNKDRAKELYLEILEQDPSFEEARNAIANLTS